VENVIDIILLLFMAVIAFALIGLTDLFAIVMLTGIFSLVSASLLVVWTAVDVAFTEAAVGAGISTLLMLAALALTTRVEKRAARRRVLPIIIVVATGAALIYGTLDMPDYGDPNAIANHHVIPRYVKDSERETGVPNIVTAVLASYRGYDTLGETFVIFTAAIGVMILLGRGRDRWRPGMRPEAMRRKEDEV
jgi:multicomponent Na+:H+ antiporter subunit B